jgi:hypothetical protein
MAFLGRHYKFKPSRIVNKNAAPTVLTSGGGGRGIGRICRFAETGASLHSCSFKRHDNGPTLQNEVIHIRKVIIYKPK